MYASDDWGEKNRKMTLPTIGFTTDGHCRLDDFPLAPDFQRKGCSSFSGINDLAKALQVGHRFALYFEDQISLTASGQMRWGITCESRHQQSSFFVFRFSWKSACKSIFTAYPAALSDWFFMFAVSRAAGWEQEEST